MIELGKAFRTVPGKISVPRPNFDALPAGIGPFLELLIQMAEHLKYDGNNERVGEGPLGFLKIMSNQELSLVE